MGTTHAFAKVPKHVLQDLVFGLARQVGVLLGCLEIHVKYVV